MRRLMRKMGLMVIYQKPRTSIPHTGHKIYLYLLRGLRVDRPGQLWCADITYVPMERGFPYLVASWTGTVGRYCPGGCPTRVISAKLSPRMVYTVSGTLQSEPQFERREASRIPSFHVYL